MNNFFSLFHNIVVYNEIWDLIMKTYTDKYFLLSHYMLKVTFGKFFTLQYLTNILSDSIINYHF